MKKLTVLCLLGLAACGADGVPISPKLALGLNIGPGGIKPTVNVVSQVGPVAVSVGH